MYKKASLYDVQRQLCMNLIAFATENYIALMEYNGGLEKVILRDSELLMK